MGAGVRKGAGVATGSGAGARPGARPPEGTEAGGAGTGVGAGARGAAGTGPQTGAGAGAGTGVGTGEAGGAAPATEAERQVLARYEQEGRRHQRALAGLEERQARFEQTGMDTMAARTRTEIEAEKARHEHALEPLRAELGAARYNELVRALEADAAARPGAGAVPPRPAERGAAGGAEPAHQPPTAAEEGALQRYDAELARHAAELARLQARVAELKRSGAEEEAKLAQEQVDGENRGHARTLEEIRRPIGAARFDELLRLRSAKPADEPAEKHP